MASRIKSRISGSTVNHTTDHNKNSKLFSKPKHKPSRSDEEVMASLVTSKIEDGNLRAAVRILCSDEKLAEENNDT